MPSDPFAVPRTPYDDSPGWSLGNHAKPTWLERDGRLDAASVHELVRRADLPISELRHMGWSDRLLHSGLETLTVKDTSLLLGRIMWDHTYGNQGEVWSGLRRQHLEAERLGRRVIRECFHV